MTVPGTLSDLTPTARSGPRGASRNGATTILVTDSGLGGLSVVADIERKAVERKVFVSLQLLFCNALPDTGQGYNRMSSAARKAAVFSDALHGMYRMYEPDIILIACNTLSAVYPQTGFARDPPVPVVGIVDLGVRLLHEKLVAQPDAAAVLFGTETTINSGAHRDGLMSLGIPARRITPQACPGLAGAIETDATGRRVATSIDRFACDAARAASPDVRSLIAGICCTHYAYCTSQFVVALQRHSGKPVEIVDPTRHMSLLVVPEGSPPVFPGPQITVAAVSRAVITAEEIVSIGGLLEPVSPATAEALRSYTVRRDLFPYDPE